MTIRRICRATLVAAPAATIAFASVAAATPPESLSAEVEFAATGPRTVTATVRNPNTLGYCWAIDADSGAIFGGKRLESFAGPGGSVTASLQSLPSGSLRAQARCGIDYVEGLQLPEFTSWTEPVTVEVSG